MDLEEIYYYRMKQPDGYGLQRLYTADGSRDDTVKVEDGDVVLVRDDAHPLRQRLRNRFLLSERAGGHPAVDGGER